MESITERIIRQRDEQAARIWHRWPEKCLEYKLKYCHKCQFFLCSFGDKPSQTCFFCLAPMTSQKLPCPYYRT